MRTEKASILITGCSSGIGLASARLLKGRGWRVLATARRSDDLARLEQAEGVEALALELADPASVKACADAVLERTEGKLYALFNNAAYGTIGAMEDIGADALRRHLEVNVIAPHELARRLIPAMRIRGAGRIVNCSSVLGFVTAPYRGTYCATKFALEAMTDAMRLELRGSGIMVSLIEPGPVATEFMPSTLRTFRDTVDVERSPHRDYYMRRMATIEHDGSFFRVTPETVARRVVRALESPWPRARYRITVPTHAAALLKRLLPGRAMDAILSRF